MICANLKKLAPWPANQGHYVCRSAIAKSLECRHYLLSLGNERLSSCFSSRGMFTYIALHKAALSSLYSCKNQEVRANHKQRHDESWNILLFKAFHNCARDRYISLLYTGAFNEKHFMQYAGTLHASVSLWMLQPTIGNVS